MKSLKLVRAKQLVLVDDPEPQPAVDEALVGVSAVGICGSDLHWFDEGGIGDSQLNRPLVLGHEFAGTILSGERRGTRVAVDPAVACGTCRYCLEGRPNLCSRLRFAGHGAQDGGLSARIAWPDRFLFPIPDKLDDADGAMLEPLGVAIHAVRLASLQFGMQVGVYGCGPIGLLIVQLARLSGARQIIATDRLPHRLEAAKNYGATQVFNANDPEVDRAIRSASGGEGVDVAFEAAGDQAAVDTAFNTTRPGTCVVLVGIPPDNRTVFSASTARHKELTIQLCRRMRHTYPAAIDLAVSGKVDLRSLVTGRFPLDSYQEAFAAAERRDGLKIVIEL